MTQTFTAANHIRGKLDAAETHRLEYICAQARRDVVETLGYIGSGHSGPSLSIIEMLVTLYFNEMRVDPLEPKWADRDRFVLSKGHGALGYYAVLSRRGFFPRQELFTFECLGSRLQGHPDTLLTPGVELSTGSLGQGLSVAAGMALGILFISQTPGYQVDLMTYLFGNVLLVSKQQLLLMMILNMKAVQRLRFAGEMLLLPALFILVSSAYLTPDPGYIWSFPGAARFFF